MFRVYRQNGSNYTNENVKHGHTICLKFGDRLCTCLTMLELKEKASICLYCCKFSVFVVAGKN